MAQETGTPVWWHERASFSNGRFGPYEPCVMVFFNGQVIAGSSTSGNLYTLDLTTFTDNGAIRKWLRSWRAHPQASAKAISYRVLEIDMETGVTPAGSNPQLVLRYSDDAHNWSHERFGSAGPTGEYDWRIRFRRLGMERRGLSSDRIFELSSTDPFKVALMGADVS